MKKIGIILSILISISSFFCFAHPGRTDSNGGHWDRTEGTYHFHTGEYVGKNKKSSSSSSSKRVLFTPPYEPPIDNSNKHSQNTKEESYAFYVVLSLLGFIFAFGIIPAIYSVIYTFFVEHLMPRRKINTFSMKINEFQRLQIEIPETNRQISNMESKLHIPSAYEIGEDNLPRDKHCISKWGPTFTLYKTANGTKLHSKRNCCSAFFPEHIYWYKDQHNLSSYLCMRCSYGYVKPDMSWYEDYLSCEQAKSKLKDMEIRYKKLQEELVLLHKKCNSTYTKAMIILSNKYKKTLKESNKKYSEMQSEKEKQTQQPFNKKTSKFGKSETLIVVLVIAIIIFSIFYNYNR